MHDLCHLRERAVIAAHITQEVGMDSDEISMPRKELALGSDQSYDARYRTL